MQRVLSSQECASDSVNSVAISLGFLRLSLFLAGGLHSSYSRAVSPNLWFKPYNRTNTKTALNRGRFILLWCRPGDLGGTGVAVFFLNEDPSV